MATAMEETVANRTTNDNVGPPFKEESLLSQDMSESRDHLSQASEEDQGVEVVMNLEGKEAILDEHNGNHNQNVFRHPPPVRPKAMRGGTARQPQLNGSGSYGYSEYHQRHPYSTPYGLSTSFDDVGSYHRPPMTQSHYSPQVHYASHGGRHPEDVNVISPHHGTPRPPATPSRRGYGASGNSQYHQYPPSSPVVRLGDSVAGTPPRARQYAMRRSTDGPYSAAMRRSSDEGAWSNNMAATSRGTATPPEVDGSRPPLVADSFDSEQQHFNARGSASYSNPSTPNAPYYGSPMNHARHQHPAPEPQFTGSFFGASFGGSFDSHGGNAPPPHVDDQRFYGRPPHPPVGPPESPYSPYASAPYHGYSPNGAGGYYDPYSPHPDYHHRGGYDEYHQHPYHAHHYPNAVTPNDRSHHQGSNGKKDINSGMLVPKAAEEIDFEVTDPPSEPITPPSKTPLCESPAEVNTYDVLCGRGGGTNSQVGNRRFRQLVQDFQPIYLLARRKEKPLLARTIVLIIRKRGGRFLKKDDETGQLFEVGDTKAEAKTSQALREGLDVRATKSAAGSLLDKKKKKSSSPSSGSVSSSKSMVEDSPMQESPLPRSSQEQGSDNANLQSPPVLPRLNPDEKPPRSPSPEALQFRKRRRMRSSDGGDPTTVGCGGVAGAGVFQEKFFSDFCPPRAELGRTGSPAPTEMPRHMPHMRLSRSSNSTPIRHNYGYPTVGGSVEDDDDDIRAESAAQSQARGCAGIAMDLVTGAATRGFCIGPRSWR